MKNLFIPLLFLFISSSAWGQYKLFEGEVGVGLPFAQSKAYNEESTNFAPSVFGEFRFNISETHFSVGANFMFRGWEVNTTDGAIIKRNMFSIEPVFDYNFKEIHNFIHPFIGIGVGIAQLGEGDGTGRSGAFMISPRVGTEIWNHARISLAYNLTEKSHSFMSVNIGFILGGGKK